MILLDVADRTALGELWLPWCVERAQPDRVLRIDHEPDRRNEARQLQVRDLDETACWSALRENAGRDSATEIENLAALMRGLATRGNLLLAAGPPLVQDEWPQGFPLPEGPMLHEGSHRVCGLYRSGVERFSVQLLVHRIFAPWWPYEHASLRHAD